MALQNPPEQLCKRCVGGEKRVHILRLSRRNEREQTDPETSLGVLGAEIARPPSGQRISPPPTPLLTVTNPWHGMVVPESQALAVRLCPAAPVPETPHVWAGAGQAAHLSSLLWTAGQQTGPWSATALGTSCFVLGLA